MPDSVLSTDKVVILVEELGKTLQGSVMPYKNKIALLQELQEQMHEPYLASKCTGHLMVGIGAVSIPCAIFLNVAWLNFHCPAVMADTTQPLEGYKKMSDALQENMSTVVFQAEGTCTFLLNQSVCRF